MSDDRPDTDEPGREQARGGSGEPPVPDSESKGAEAPAQASDELTPEREAGASGAEAAAHTDVDQTQAVQVPEAHEAGGIPDDFRAEVEEIMGRYPQKRSASIPVLFAIQRRYGWCTPEGIRQGAAVMGVSAAYLESVASFYDLFHLEPAGRHRVLVCTNISCWMRGADGLLKAFCEAGGADPDAAGHGGTVTADGEAFIQGFECLGACDMAPMASIDERYYGPLEEADAAAALDALRSGGEILPGKEMARRPLAGGPEAPPDPRVTNAG